MSSFCGAISITERYLTPGLLDKMALTLSYWNPNKVEVIHNTDVGMAHLSWSRPSDSSNQALPFDTPEYMVCGDLRLDNQEDLQNLLNLPPNTSDQIIILEAYRKWSEKCAEHLLGDFAFVIWDKKNRTAFCARDHIGIKPFYYFYDKGIFAFASEKKALLCIPSFEKKINYPRLTEILTYGVIGTLEYSEQTEYQNIFQLRPAHTSSLRNGKLSSSKYWDLSLDNEASRMSLEDSVQGLRELLDQAVKCRIGTTGKIGAELSGGLDSSILTALAVKYRTDLNTFSSVLDSDSEFFLNERPYVENLCDYLNIENRHFVSSEGFDFERELKRCVHILDGIGFGLGNVFRAPIVNKAEEEDCKVVISGFGGDECASYSGTNTSSHLNNSSGYRESIKRILCSRSPSLLRMYREWKNPDSALIQKETIIQPNLLKTGAKLSDSYLSYGAMMSRSKEKGDHAHLREGLTGRRSEYVRSVVSSISCYSKKTNFVFPLLDIRVLKFMLSVPSKYRHHADINRYLMRQAGEGIIPDELRLRKNKAGFISPAPYYEYTKFYRRQTGKASPLVPIGKNLSSEERVGYLKHHLERGAFLYNSACDAFLDLL